jgi:hypothetical protein
MRLRSRRYAYLETRDVSAVVSLSPPAHAVAAVLPKRRPLGLVVPGPWMVVRAAANRLQRFEPARGLVTALRVRFDRS